MSGPLRVIRPGTHPAQAGTNAASVDPADAVRDARFRGYYETARTGLLDLLDTAPGCVLEIGCGGGANLSELKRRYPACRTVGVELQPEAAAVALRHHAVDEVRSGDILDAAAVDFADASFDVIVMSHVLEHFSEPARVIARALPWLAPQGRLLVALPNVRHVSVLLELFWRGDFRYRDAGILDATHLRFFTRKSALRFFQHNGLQVDKAVPDIDGAKSRLLHGLSLGLASDFAAFAHNFLLRKR